MIKTLGIVGSAGRKEDKDKLSKEIYDKMCEIGRVVGLILKSTRLVSGGAAYADNAAIKIWLENREAYKDGLVLHLPCEFKDSKFLDNGNKDYKLNPGRTVNYYHKLFSEKCNFDSLAEIDLAIKSGAKVVITKGLFNRNTKMAQDSDALLAMTFGLGDKLKYGGTSDTMGKYLRKIKDNNLPNFSYHYDLTTKILFNNARVEELTEKEEVIQDTQQKFNLTQVVHCKKDEYDTYLGRFKDGRIESFGNPFIFQNSTLPGIRVKDRAEALEAYEQWLRGTKYQDLEPNRRTWILDNLHTLLGKKIACFCCSVDKTIDLPCHGHILIKLLKEKLCQK